MRSAAAEIATTMTVIALAYLTGYVAVRIAHTRSWFDKNTEEAGSYTFFDSESESDTLLYRTFYPMLVADDVILKRPFERDKW